MQGKFFYKLQPKITYYIFNSKFIQIRGESIDNSVHPVSQPVEYVLIESYQKLNIHSFNDIKHIKYIFDND